MDLSSDGIERVWSFYDRGTIMSFEKTRMGVVNHNWFLTTTTGTFVLRCVNADKFERDLNAEFTFIATLEGAGFAYAMPTPLTAKDGSHTITHEGRRFWSYPFIEGRTITSPVTRSQAEQMGVMIARMHLIIERSDVKRQLSNPVFSMEQVIDDARALFDDHAHGERAHGSADMLEGFLDIVARTPYPSGLEAFPIHRDLNPENVLFKNDVLGAVLDFDNASAYEEPFARDLANALLYSCTHERCSFDFDRCEDLVSAYRSVRPLTSDDIEAIPNLIVLGCFEDFAYEHWLAIHEPERTNAAKLEKRFTMGRWAFEHRDELTRMLRASSRSRL